MAVDSDTPVYSIGSAARLLGISVHTIRMYEREGLLVPFRTDTNQRRYSQNDIDHINCIRRAINEKRIGIGGIQSLQSLIPCWKVKHCPDGKRQQCSAYRGHSKGCWSYKLSTDVSATNECRTCEAYGISTDCSKIKDYIISMSTNDVLEG